MRQPLEPSPRVNHHLLPLPGPELASKLGYPSGIISQVLARLDLYK